MTNKIIFLDRQRKIQIINKATNFKPVSTYVALKGDTGSQGSVGADGKSAFQVWKELQTDQTQATIENFLLYLQMGPVGPQGPQGPQGLQGIQGEQGLQGIQGEVGPQGQQGIQGFQGVQGEVGPQGQQGLQGPIGKSAYQSWLDIGGTGTEIDFLESIVGLTGDSAYQSAVRLGFTGTEQDWLLSLIGAIGPQGVQGPVGPQGIQGPQGLTGDTGPQGPQGLTGATGATGSQGIQGIQGPQGLTGDTGPQGPQGEQGIQGIQGEVGPQGIQGLTGATGATGPQGIQGIQGEVGPQGIQGLTGVGISNVSIINNELVITLTNSNQLNLGNIKGNDGTSIATGYVNTNGELILTLTDNTIINVGVVKGETGATGTSCVILGSYANPTLLPTTGDLGDAYIVDSDGDLYVFNGTNYVSVGQIVGPQGPQGLQGIQGPQGLTGATGPQGIQGIQGEVGPQGPQGLQGIQGPQGLTGDTGPQGPQGLAGATGPQGIQGPQGLTGDTGPQGPQGNDGVAGVGIQTASINGSGELILTLTNAVQINIGVVKGQDGDAFIDNSITSGIINRTASQDAIYQALQTKANTSDLSTKENTITKSLGYATWNGSNWVFKNEAYSLSTHTHDFSSVYAPIVHDHNGTYYTQTQINTLLTTKQDSLVSGTNLKTVNNESLLGAGNIVVSGGASNLSGLSDVGLANPAIGEALVYETNDYPYNNPSYDQHYANVKALFNLNGTDGSTIYVDSSPLATNALFVGTPTLSTAQKKFGTASSYHENSPESGFKTSVAQATLSTIFTIELFTYPLNINKTNTIILTNSTNLGVLSLYQTTNGFEIWINGRKNIGTNIISVNNLGSYTQDSWNHIAIVKNNASWYLFINGMQIATATDSTVLTVAPLIFGYNANPDNFYGYIDSVRITDAVARYTSNFSLPQGEFGDDSTPIIHNYVDEFTNRALSASDVGAIPTTGGAVNGNLSISGELTVGDTVNPTGIKAYVKSGSSGRAWAPNQNLDVVVENSTIAGINIIGGNASQNRIYFSDTDAEAKGSVIYDHATDSMLFGTNGTTKATLDSAGNLTVPQIYNNTTASTGNVYVGEDGLLYRSTAVGGGGGSSLSESGIDKLQRSMASGKISYIQPIPGVTTPTVFGVPAPTVIGTASGSGMSANPNLYSNQPRVYASVSPASTSAIAGWRFASGYWCFGGQTNAGGFFYRQRFAYASVTSLATRKLFCGMSSVFTAPTNANTLVANNGQFVGVGCDEADANLCLVYAGSNGTLGKINLGTDFSKTNAAGMMVEVEIKCTTGPTPTVTYKVMNVLTGITTSGTITNGASTIPSTAVLVSPRLYTSVGGTSSTIGIELMATYIERLDT